MFVEAHHSDAEDFCEYNNKNKERKRASPWAGNKMTILYLIRHGETGGNYEGRFQGIIDNPLNEYGIRQAKMLGEAFSLSKIDVLYTSCLLYTSDAADEL